ncbi:MAG TPA: hypothetical protein VNO17_01945 [Actinomycetota bacterium]|nr:hypothetical protein [Actinomycetota bacterium]
MWRFLFIPFLVAHGGVHVAMWATPKAKDAPFDPSHSWLLGDRRGVAIVVALVAAALLVGAGVGLWAHAEWWRPVAVAGLAVSFGLMVLFFHPWFLFIQAVNAALIVGLVWLDWPSRSMVGA